ncbi:MAG: hypothetical protein KAI74_05945 [Kiritimatiellae bacterium]|nr:hypothetical protein [Kiritimatiellia bacterium]
MEIKIKIDENITSKSDFFPEVGLTLMRGKAELGLDEFRNSIRTASAALSIGEFDCNVQAVRGDQAIWIPYGNGKGLKILFWDIGDDDLANMQYIRERGNASFAKIFRMAAASYGCSESKGECVLIEMEDMRHWRSLWLNRGFVKRPYLLFTTLLDIVLPNHRQFMMKQAWRELIKWRILPEDDWSKRTNFIGGKMVDYHKYKFFPERYSFNASSDISAMHGFCKDMFEEKRNMRAVNYQGFRFNNGFCLPGYSSDGCEFDTYLKLSFMPMHKVKNKLVLDLGANECFYSFQSVVHGAERVHSIEFDPDKVRTSKLINSNFFGCDNISFTEGDIVEYVMSGDRTHYEVTFLLSVIHQIFPDFKGADAFFDNLSKMTSYLAFETPIRHPLMKCGVWKVQRFLKKYFWMVRPLYVYHAYSSGWRVIFVCYGYDENGDRVSAPIKALE